MKEYSHVFLDWDGNIYNSLEIWLHACRSLFDQCEVEISNRDIARYILPELQAATRFGIQDFDTFLSALLSLIDTVIHTGCFYPGALEVIATLANQNIDYAIVTSTRKPFLEKVLAHHGVTTLFPHRVTRDDVTKVKPDPEPLLKAMALIGATNESSLMIGDSHSDIKVGQAVGMDTVLFFPDSHHFFYDHAELLKCTPTYVCASWAEVLQILNLA